MKNILLWILAFFLTASTAVYQRMTGPTYPYRGKTILNGKEIKFKLLRSHEIGEDCKISVDIPDPEIDGRMIYKRLNSPDPWTDLPMTTGDKTLSAVLPSQLPAGKLEYKIFLKPRDGEVSLSGEEEGEGEVSLSGEEPIIIRFKGKVPITVLHPHILIMFLAMLFSMRAGIEALRPKSNPRTLVIWTAALLFVGGMILGPLVQNFAFGQLWTGVPFGTDLTDNKTLIAMIGWIIAVIAGRKGKPARGWVIGASILLLIVFLVPHSLFGSELDYTDTENPSNQIAMVIRN